MDQQEALLSALKLAMHAKGEQRLFRQGKLPGLFAARTSPFGEASAEALAEGYLELVRTESKGKTSTDWVRLTAKGTEFLLQHTSPMAALDELRQLLRINQEGLPTWVAQLRCSVDDLTQKFAAEVGSMRDRLDALAVQVAKTLAKVEKSRVELPESVGRAFPWTKEVLGHLEGRGALEGAGPCSLPDLFALLREHHADLTLKEFHQGLRRLHETGTVKLLPCTDPAGPPEPEFALLDAAVLYYFAELP